MMNFTDLCYLILCCAGSFSSEENLFKPIAVGACSTMDYIPVSTVTVCLSITLADCLTNIINIIDKLMFYDR